MSFSIRANGVAELLSRMASIRTAFRQAAATTVTVGSPLVYAPIQERRYPYLAPAAGHEQARVNAEMTRGLSEALLNNDPEAIVRGMQRGAEAVQQEAQRIVHVRTGRLRDSIHVETYRRS